jgi:hypothetical protein
MRHELVGHASASFAKHSFKGRLAETIIQERIRTQGHLILTSVVPSVPPAVYSKVPVR